MVRHGRTDWNRDGRFQGHADIPLNEEGRAQAAHLARALAQTRFDRCVSSDLSRALETARAICSATPPAIEIDPRWREYHFGDWEGLTWEQIVASTPALSGLTGTAVDVYAPPRGETYADVRARVADALDACSASDGHVLIVTHAGPLHAALDVLLGDGKMTTRLAPAGITRLARVGDAWSLLSLGQ